VIFTARDYRDISKLVFRGDYPGFKPDVLEAPNGDGEVDAGKRYAHVNLDIFAARDYRDISKQEWAILRWAWETAYLHAQEIAHNLGVDDLLAPEDSTLRILEYPPMATTVPHKDFDLFTVQCYRAPGFSAVRGIREETPWHGGELLQEFTGGVLAALEHSTVPVDYPQHSIVFFAMPGAELVLPSGKTVGAWVEERKARSRVPADASR
jgi:hypothetical protein